MKGKKLFKPDNMQIEDFLEILDCIFDYPQYEYLLYLIGYACNHISKYFEDYDHVISERFLEYAYKLALKNPNVKFDELIIELGIKEINRG